MAKLIEKLIPGKEDTENAKNIGTLIEHATSHWPDNVAITSLGSNISYTQIDRGSNAIANWLTSYNFVAGNPIAVMVMTSSIE